MADACAYCMVLEQCWKSILCYKCDGCRLYVHYDCIKSKQPSPLLGDAFFKFKCTSCGEENKEEFERLKLSWRNVVMLTMYNLHKTGQGKCGFFHWKAHIAAFIEANWVVFFGYNRKKTGLWMGTIAGALSAGCPSIFESGSAVVDQGYWKLVDVTPPLVGFEKKVVKQSDKRQPKHPPVDLDSLPDTSRRRSKNFTLSAASALKEKRATFTVNRRKKSSTDEGTSGTQVAKQPDMASHPQHAALQVNDSAIQHQTHNLIPAQTHNLAPTQTHNLAPTQTHNLAPTHSHVTPSQIQHTAADQIYPVATNHSLEPFQQGRSRTPLEDSSSRESSEHGSLLFVESSDVKQEMENTLKEQQQAITSTSVSDSGVSPKSGLLQQEAKSLDAHAKITYTSLGLTLGEEDDDDLDLDMDVDIESVAVLTDEGEEVNALLPDLGDLGTSEDIEVGKTVVVEADGVLSDAESEGQSEKDIEEEEEKNQSQEEEDSGEDGNDSESTDDADEDEDEIVDDDTQGVPGQEQGQKKTKVRRKTKGRPRKRRRLDDPLPVASPEKLQRISVFEEAELLKRLNVLADSGTLTPDLTVLRRKLICNQTNREYGQPVFDLDAQVKKMMARTDPIKAVTEPNDVLPSMPKLPPKPSQAQSKETRDLDRFMMKDGGKKKETRTYTTFRQRLVGFDESDLKPTVSPYTTRVLMPFIWRNTSSDRLPLKIKLMQEIQAFPHRNDPSWVAPSLPSIDYCYVRPEHIASVNALSREFFWPGIDMSECLQYPDFSCVVLYRKIVIAFAFMVPDRGYNEAYISFIFTHPEWRGVGIASFMLYHLIQTCMGKDVLLHVSASNPAMLLYQKFGFKAEELSLNFYHKYFPWDSTDSHHAFLMRLSR